MKGRGGEFSDGILSGYIDEDIVVERNQFFRIYYSANGLINLGAQKKLFQKNKFPHFRIDNDESLDRFYIGFYVFNRLLKNRNPSFRLQKDTYAKIYAYNQVFLRQGLEIDPDIISKNLARLDEKWLDFIEFAKSNTTIGNRAFVDKATGEARATFHEKRLYRSSQFEEVVVQYFENIS